MLAKEIIFQQLSTSYSKLLKAQIQTRAQGVVDKELECNVAMAYSLIKIYPWLDYDELEDWRDKVENTIEEVCNCDVPCITCDEVIFDPLTMKWISNVSECEDVESKWIPLKESIICEDNGVTTTQPIPTTTQLVTTTKVTGCYENISHYYKPWSEGPNSFECLYEDCSGVLQRVTFTKDKVVCISFKEGTLRPVDPNHQHYVAHSLTLGVYSC